MSQDASRLYRPAPLSLHQAMLADIPRFTSDLAELIAIPSVSNRAWEEAGAPFGKSVREVLELALRQAKRLGLRTYAEPQGYYGYAEIGRKITPRSHGVRIDIPVHLDVVPGLDLEAWETGDPFKLLVRHDAQLGDHILMGRGTIDDKGPAVMAMHVLSALAATKLDPAVTLRIVFSLSEETFDWIDMERYLGDHGFPDVAMIPDTAFPWLTEQDIIVTETRGMGTPLPEDHRDLEGIRLERIDTGENPFNRVPDSVRATLAASSHAALRELQHNMRASLASTFEGALRLVDPEMDDHARSRMLRDAAPLFSEIREEAGSFRMEVLVRGIDQHACEGWMGINAIHQFATALSDSKMADTIPARSIHMIQEMIQQGLPANNLGYFLGIEEKPAATHGRQTFTISILKADDAGIELVTDHRVRLGTSIEVTRLLLRRITERHGFQTETKFILPGITPPDNHPALSIMREALLRETGAEALPGIDGGGTIAREFNDPQDPTQLSIGFGPLPTWHPLTEHKTNEFFSMRAIQSGMRIYLNTLHSMASIGSPYIGMRMQKIL